jgi:hypothetical protein
VEHRFQEERQKSQKAHDGEHRKIKEDQNYSNKQWRIDDREVEAKSVATDRPDRLSKEVKVVTRGCGRMSKKGIV